MKLNHFFCANEHFGFQWLQTIGYLPSDSQIEDLKVTSASSFQKIETLKKTNITLLSALVTPNTDEDDLKLSSKLNAWLFINDNLFDQKDSFCTKNLQISEKILQRYRIIFTSALQDISVSLSYDDLQLPHDVELKLRSLDTGLRDIGLCASKLPEKIQERVIYGLDKYIKGVLQETYVRSSSADSSLSISYDTFFSMRGNAGAVDWVFELALGLDKVELKEDVRKSELWKQFFKKAKYHICLFNDIVSRNKEAEEESLDNFVLISESLWQLTTRQAFSGTTTELDTSISEMLKLKLDLQSKFGDPITPAISCIENWVVGHVIWELASFSGRRPKIPCISQFESNLGWQ